MVTTSKATTPTPFESVSARSEKGHLERLGRILSSRLGLDVESIARSVRAHTLADVAEAEGHSIERVLDHLDEHPAELARFARRLFGTDQDFLRDDELASLVERMSPWPARTPLRAWLVGCGEGEAAYRLAFELVLRLELDPEALNLFATDLDQYRLKEAGRGHVSEAFVRSLPEGAQEWIASSERGYLLKGSLRSRLAFAFHDILRTPPFGRLDLLVCRQTLQNLTQGALRHALHRFAFSVRPGGLLAVHPLVPVAEIVDGFELEAPEAGIYRRREIQTQVPTTIDPIGRTRLLEKAAVTSCVARGATAVVVDVEGRIQAVIASGQDVLGESRGWDPSRMTQLVDPSLEGPLERALDTVRRTSRSVTQIGLPLADGRVADLTVGPIEAPGLYLVELRPRAASSSEESGRAARRVAELEAEVSRLRSERDETVSALEAENARLNDDVLRLREDNARLLDDKQELQSREHELQIANETLEARVEALEALGSQADALFESGDVAAIFLGPDGRVWRCSPAVSAILGMEPILGAPLGVSAFDREVLDAVHRVLEGGESIELERPIRGRHVLIRVLPRDLERTIGPGAVVTFTDLSRVWQETVAAEAQARQLASLFETANDPTLECKLDGQIVYANAAARGLLGLEADPSLSIVEALERVGASQPGAVTEVLEAARHGLRRPRVTVAFPARNEVFDVTARPLYAGGAVTRVVVAARDVTELDASRRSARAARALMQAVLDSLPDAIAVVDGEGRVVTHNQAWTRSRASSFPGATAEDGTSLLEALDAEEAGGREAAGMVASYLRAVLDGRAAADACRYPILVDGATHHLETTATRLSHAGQELTVVIQSDVTSVKLAEQQRLEVQAKLLDADKAESLGVLAGGVAHDFNNLLVGILSNASFVLDQAEAGSLTEECLKDIETSAERAAELCQQLLAFSGRGQFCLEPLRLDAIVRDSLRLLQASIQRSVNLDVVIPERELPEITADASQLRQVLFNLVTNGAEAISSAGTVRVTLGVETLSAERIARASQGDGARAGTYVMLRVSDDGEGMTEEVRSRIFEPFFTTKFTGRGLGLAAVQGIVLGHNGLLEVQTELGRGTTISAYFPLSDPAEAEPEAPRPAILVVDDEEVVRVAAARALVREGFEVLAAASGAEAVALFDRERERTALVLLDVTMPGMSGEEVYTRLRARSRTVPVLFSSGLPEMADGQRLTGEDRTFFIQKPYRARALSERVRTILAEEDQSDRLG